MVWYGIVTLLQHMESVDTLQNPRGMITACGNLGQSRNTIQYYTTQYNTIGNTYELLGDYKTAAEFHLKRLKLAQEVRME